MDRRETTAQRGITLASASPRRSRLLRVLGVPFAVRPVDVPEDRLGDEAPEEMVVRLSVAKARAVAVEPGYDIALGSDTAVTLPAEGGTLVLGKPASAEDARPMLAVLGGREHAVFTGLAVLDRRSGRCIRGYQRVPVRLRRMEEPELSRYVASGIGDDKAGAYAIQDRRFGLVEALSGCAAAVMGLPLCAVARAFAALGLPVPSAAEVARGCSELTGMICCLEGDGGCPELVLYG